MNRCKIFKQKAFEKAANFEKRLNDEIMKGWRPVSIAGSAQQVVVLLIRNYE